MFYSFLLLNTLSLTLFYTKTPCAATTTYCLLSTQLVLLEQWGKFFPVISVAQIIHAITAIIAILLFSDRFPIKCVWTELQETSLPKPIRDLTELSTFKSLRNSSLLIWCLCLMFPCVWLLLVSVCCKASLQTFYKCSINKMDLFIYVVHYSIELCTCIKHEVRIHSTWNYSLSLRQQTYRHPLYLFNCMVQQLSLLILFNV